MGMVEVSVNWELRGVSDEEVMTFTHPPPFSPFFFNPITSGDQANLLNLSSLSLRSHSSPSSPSHGSDLVQGQTTCVQVAVPDCDVGAIFGRGGSMMNEIQQISGAR